MTEVSITVPTSAPLGPELELTGIDAEALKYGASILGARLFRCPGSDSVVVEGAIDGHVALIRLIHPRFILDGTTTEATPRHGSGTSSRDARVRVVAESYQGSINPVEFKPGTREVDLGRVSLPEVIVRNVDGQWHGDWSGPPSTLLMMMCGGRRK